MRYQGYKLTSDSRKKLKKKFPPKFPDFSGDHVTYNLKPDKENPLPPEADIFVVGHASSESIEALVVSINGETVREDGVIYHITWSLNRSMGVSPKDSKELLEDGFRRFPPIRIVANPEVLIS